MRAILVSVDYTDLLKVTLPYNRHHFEQVWVVTTPQDAKVIVEWLSTVPYNISKGVYVHETMKFYDNGAIFNKWAALEEGLDAMGRQGWVCLMDADVLWPTSERFVEVGTAYNQGFPLERGYLYTPLRRMLDPIPTPFSFPPEKDWCKLPIHPNVNEWAGYSQIFHADDPLLQVCADCWTNKDQHSSILIGCSRFTWHETNWKHAGGADSFFQAKWPREKRIRPPFQVLHIGPAGRNWCGRSTPFTDGSTHKDSTLRAARVREFMLGRRGKEGLTRYEHEKIKDKD